MLLLKWIKNKNDDDGVRGEIFQVKNTSNEIHCARSDRYMGGGGRIGWDGRGRGCLIKI